MRMNVTHQGAVVDVIFWSKEEQGSRTVIIMVRCRDSGISTLDIGTK